MRMPRNKMAAVAAVGLVAAGGSAFTASNVVPESAAGYGAQTVSGYTASDITYGLKTPLAGDATDEEVATVTFVVTPTDTDTGAATKARARVTGTGTAATAVYADCTAATPAATAPATKWQCVVGAAVKAADITGLNVIAAQ
jgi:hypothetical protein